MIRRTVLSLILIACLPVCVQGDLTNYNQDFESLIQSDPNALGNNGWLGFGNVYDPGGNFIYGYGTFPAPNGGPGFSAIAKDEAGPNQGVQYINIYSDYNNGDHNNGNLVEANVFQEQTIGAVDLGASWEFEFDYLANPLAAPAQNATTSTAAFIKVLDPNAGFATVYFDTLDTTGASTTTWSEDNIMSVDIDAAWTDHLLQFGFQATSTNFDPTGVFYDNVTFGVPEPTSAAVLGLGCLALAIRRRRK